MPTEIEKTAIANLQRYLRTLYYFDDALSSLPVDGVFDRATEEAVPAVVAYEAVGIAYRNGSNKLIRVRGVSSAVAYRLSLGERVNMRYNGTQLHNGQRP